MVVSVFRISLLTD